MIDKAKVRELVNMLQANQNLDCYERKTYFEIVDEWLEQNQSEPQVVGLSDEQVGQLADFMYEHDHQENYDFGSMIFDFLKTQTFTQPEQFTPNWEDAPSWANWVAQDGDGQWNWFGCKPFPDDNLMSFTLESLDDVYARVRSVIKNWQQTLQERPKPQFKAGQVWINIETESKYQIDSIGKSRDSGVWVECVTYRSLADGCFYTRALDDFMTKFVRVSDDG